MVKPTVISTFAGTGGSSLGYKWAGFKELLAIDFDPHAVECFRLNFPEVPCWKRSVVDVSGKEILDFCKIKKGELDVFDGSPPCQGFSTAGKREVNDPRNDLFMHYWRLVDELQPKVFVMENVPGMVKGKMRGRFIEVMNTLKSGNYRVACKKMNSMWYGVPQSRERLIFIGIRKDLNKKPVFPIPSKKIISVMDVCPEIKRIGNGQFKKESGSSFGAFDHTSDGVSCTITKTPSMICEDIHGKKRQPTIIEVKRLCSFPDDWKLGSNHSRAWNRLGNAVMPKFMQAIAESVKNGILK